METTLPEEYLICKERRLCGNMIHRYHYFSISSSVASSILVIAAILISAINGQNCEDTVGSLDHDSNIIMERHTSILNGYIVPCKGTVIAWEFCYRVAGISSVTFYPGIWKMTRSTNGINYALVQSNILTYKPVQMEGDSHDSCHRVNLSVGDQFIAPVDSVVGLFADLSPQLLHTRNLSSISTYQFEGNKSIVNITNSRYDVNYNIAIKVHLEPTNDTTASPMTSTIPNIDSSTDIPTSDTTTVTPTNSIVSTSNTTTVTPTTSIVSTSNTTTVTPTTSIVSTSDTTTVTPTTSIVFTSNTITVTPTTLIVSTSDTTTVTPTILIAPTSDTTTVTSTTLIVSTSDTTIVTPTILIAPTNDTTTVTPTNSRVSTSDTTTVTPTIISIISTIDITTVTPTILIISTSDITTVTPTTSIVSTSDTTTVTPTISIISTSDITTVTPTILIISTSNTTTVTPAFSMVSSSDITTVTPTISIRSTSSTTVVVNAGAGSGSDNEGGSPIGIIAGAVIGVILCIIVLLVVVILLWRFSRQRKRKIYSPQATQNLELTGKCDVSQDLAVSNDSNYYSSAENKPNVKHNGNVIYKNVSSEYEALSDYKNVKKSDGASPYSDSTGKNYSRFASNDYEVAPKMAEYETAIQLYSNNMRESNAYDDSRMSEYSEVADAIAASDGEEIYSDPGHCKEDIYACFEKKKFRIIKRNDVSVFQELGSGEFGVVHLGTWTDVCSDPVQVAVKTLNSQCSESDRIKFLREAAIMGQFKHENVVQLHGVVTEEENMMIVLEFMPKGDLQEFLIKLKNTTPPETFNELKHDLLSYCRHVSAGLSHLASKGFVHRDLAARNILVSSDDVCKIADFGMARDVTDDTYYVSSGGKVPLKWTAPEAIFYKKYSIQSDVWSFGCVMYEIWSLGYKPFEDLGGIEYVRKITTGYRLPPPPGCPRAIYELMIKCWHPVANKRIDSCSLNKALQQSNRALLPGAISAKDNKELSTGLGDPLATSSHLYQNLQNIYLSTIKL